MHSDLMLGKSTLKFRVTINSKYIIFLGCKAIQGQQTSFQNNFSGFRGKFEMDISV